MTGRSQAVESVHDEVAAGPASQIHACSKSWLFWWLVREDCRGEDHHGDRNRIPVRGLVADDFALSEDGNPQKITSFTEVKLAAPAVRQTGWMRDVAPDVRGNDHSGAQDFTTERGRLLRAIDSFTPALTTNPLPPAAGITGDGDTSGTSG